MAGIWTTISILDGLGGTKTMRAWDESGTGAGPYSLNPASNQRPHTDRSGTIAVGGTAQIAIAANAQRVGFSIQNVSVADLWMNGLATAIQSQPSIWLPPGAFYESPESGVQITDISLIGGTTGQAFSAREW